MTTLKAKPRRSRKPSARLESTRTQWDEVSGVFTSRSPDAKQLTTVAELDEYLATKAPGERGGIDIRGRVIAQAGPFKDLRGEFDAESLSKIVELGNAKQGGLKSNFKHRSMSDDNLGKHLGRDHELYLSQNSQGVASVKSKHFVLNTMSMKPSPEGGGTPYGEYVAGLAISDPSSFSSSLTLSKKSERRLDESGRPEKDAQGNRKPDLWRPTHLHSIDVVSIGDAVDDFLGHNDGSEEQLLEQATQMFQKFFNADEMTPEAAKARLDGFAEKVILSAFENKDTPDMSDDNNNENSSPEIAELLAAQAKTNETLGALTEGIGSLVETLKPSQPETSDESPAELSRDQFITKVTALCEAQGKPEMLGGFLKDKKLTIDSVKDALLAANKDELSMDSDNDHQGGGKKNQLPGDKKPWQQLSSDEVESRLNAEYQEGAEVHQNLGLSFEAYASDRKIELGLAPETSPLLPVNKKVAAGIAGALLVIVCLGLAFGFSAIDAKSALLLSSFVPMVGMAVTADQLLHQGGNCQRVRRKVKSATKIYNGTVTFLKDGLISGTFEAGAVFGGVAFNHADNSEGGDGDLETETLFHGLVAFSGIANTLTSANFESEIYATDNWTLTTTNTNAVKVGVLKDIDEKGRPVIFMG